MAGRGLEVGRNGSVGRVRAGLALNLVQPHVEIGSLPLPPDTIDASVVEVEDGVVG